MEELKKQMEDGHRIQIVLPPMTGEEKGSCPPAYVDALQKLCDWYRVIENRLYRVCNPTIILKMKVLHFFLLLIVLLSIATAYNPFPQNEKLQ